MYARLDGTNGRPNYRGHIEYAMREDPLAVPPWWEYDIIVRTVLYTGMMQTQRFIREKARIRRKISAAGACNRP